MIVLHRLTHPDQPFYLNPDLIHAVEATPDTVISLGATKVLVIESPEEVVQRVREWRASIIARAAETVPFPVL
jgi:uncharacterized protein YlzI (FlbEa/FlbD family)